MLDNVPAEVSVVKQRNGGKALNTNRTFFKQIDEETQLVKEELLLGPEEGLLNEDALEIKEVVYEAIFTNPLIGSGNSNLFEVRTVNKPVEKAITGRSRNISTSGPSSEHVITTHQLRNLCALVCTYGRRLWIYDARSCL